MNQKTSQPVENTPAARRLGAIAVLEAELDAMDSGAICYTDRLRAEVELSIGVLKASDDDHIDSTLAAIFEVRHTGFEVAS